MNKARIIKNGKIITMDETLPQAEAVLIVDGIIKAVGTNEEILKQGNQFTEIIDAKGNTVIPGLIDSHIHMLSGALSKLQMSLKDRTFKNREEMMYYLKEESKGQKGWIKVAGFSEEQIKEGKQELDKDVMDKVFPDQPVVIIRVCGHMCNMNKKAMELLSIQEDIKDPEGGRFERDEKGFLTGAAKEKAQQYVLDRIPQYTDEQVLVAMEKEQEILLSYGICSIHDAGTDQIEVKKYIELYEQFLQSGKMKINTYLMTRIMNNCSVDAFIQYVQDLKNKYTILNSKLFFGGVKLFADGSMGSKTAGLYAGYKDDKENKGLLITKDLDAYIEKCHEVGLQTITHAIGDRAIEYVADKIIAAQEKNQNSSNRHRIEHCEVINHTILEKLKANKIFAMVQPVFIYDFADTYIERVGIENIDKINVFKTMIERKITIGFGTDYPYSELSPMIGLGTACTREAKTGTILNKNEAIDIKEAIKCYTMHNAKSSFTESYQGSITNNKLGDLVILDCNIENIPMDKIKEIKVQATICRGERVYQG